MSSPVDPTQGDVRPGRRRRWPRIVVPVAVLLVAALVATGAYVWTLDRAVTSNLTRQPTLPMDLPSGPGLSPRPTKPPNAAGTLNYVLLGADSDPDPGDPLRGRSDTIMVAHLNAARTKAYIISFPRDMWVSVPGRGKAKINAAYAYGGPALTTATLEGLLNARMDHVAIIDFDGFVRLTETLGGVTVTNSTAFSSHGYDYPEGRITLSGEQALWFVRERKSLPNGDLDRAANQRKVIKAIVAKGLSPAVVGNPATFTAFLGGVARYLTVDDGLTDAEVRSTALSLRLGADDIELLQAPIEGFGTSPDGQSIDLVDPDRLRELGTAIREDQMSAYVAKYPGG